MNSVIDLARYRERQHHPQPQKTEVPSELEDDLLDVLSYHLLMAGRAIAAYSKK